MELRFISWNACGIRNVARLVALREHAYQHNPTVIFIQKAFVGPLLGDRQSPTLSSYVSYVHPIRNGLITYVHSSVSHQLLCTSDDADMTVQLLEVALGLARFVYVMFTLPLEE